MAKRFFDYCLIISLTELKRFSCYSTLQFQPELQIQIVQIITSFKLKADIPWVFKQVKTSYIRFQILRCVKCCSCCVSVLRLARMFLLYQQELTVTAITPAERLRPAYTRGSSQPGVGGVDGTGRVVVTVTVHYRGYADGVSIGADVGPTGDSEVVTRTTVSIVGCIL